jgi:CBS domain-containing protein
MDTITVKQLATPLDQYTQISEDACLGDAFLALERAFKGDQQTDPHRPRDFAVMVVNQQGNVVGRLTVWDILQGLEVQTFQRVDGLSMVEGFSIWRQPLAHLATKAKYVLVKNIVSRLPKHEFIDENATLDQAIHQLLKHRSLSLITTRQDKPVGVLRVVDVFNDVLNRARNAAKAIEQQ